MESLLVHHRRAMRLLLTLTLLGLLATPSAHAQDLPPPKFTVEVTVVEQSEYLRADGTHTFVFESRITCTEWSPYLIEKSIQVHYDLLMGDEDMGGFWIEVHPFRTNDKPSPEDCMEQRPITHRIKATAEDTFGTVEDLPGLTDHNFSLHAEDIRFDDHWWANGTIHNPIRGKVGVEPRWQAEVQAPGQFGGHFRYYNGLNVAVAAEYRPVLDNTTPGLVVDNGTFTVAPGVLESVRIPFDISATAFDGADSLTLAFEVHAHPQGRPDLALAPRYHEIQFEVDPRGHPTEPLILPPPLVVVLLVAIVFLVVRHQQRSKLS